MAGVFISYSQADAAMAQRVMLGLRALGVDVWWDDAMSSVDRYEALMQQADGLVAVVALWTPSSINSDVVWDEAGFGQKRGRLVNLLHGADEPPFMFGSVEPIRLDGWTAREAHAGWRQLIETLDAQQAAVGRAAPGALLAALVDETDERERRQAEVEARPGDDARKAGFDDWLRARGAAIGDTAVADAAPSEPARPLSLFIPAAKLPLAGLDAALAQPTPVPASPPAAADSAATGEAALDALSAAVERALAAGPDGHPLGRVLRSPLRPPVPAPVAAAVPDTPPSAPAAPPRAATSHVPLLSALAVIAVVILAGVYFILMR